MGFRSIFLAEMSGRELPTNSERGGLLLQGDQGFARAGLIRGFPPTWGNLSVGAFVVAAAICPGEDLCARMGTSITRCSGASTQNIDRKSVV